MDDMFDAFENELDETSETRKMLLTMDAIDAYTALIMYITELESRIGIYPDGYEIAEPEDFIVRRNMALESFTVLGELVALGVDSVQ